MAEAPLYRSEECYQQFFAFIDQAVGEANGRPNDITLYITGGPFINWETLCDIVSRVKDEPFRKVIYLFRVFELNKAAAEIKKWAGPRPWSEQHEDILDYFLKLNTDRDELWCSYNVHKTFHTKWAAYDCGSDSVTDHNHIRLLLTSANFIEAHLSRERRETANINFSSKDLSCSKTDFHNYFTSAMRTNCWVKMYRLRWVTKQQRQETIWVLRFREYIKCYCGLEEGLEDRPQVTEEEEEDGAPDLEAEESEEIADEGDAVGQLTAEMDDLNLDVIQSVQPQNCTNTKVYLKVLEFLDDCRVLTNDHKFWIISPFIGNKPKGVELFLPTTLEQILSYMHEKDHSAKLKIVHKKRSPDNQMYVVGGNGNVNVDYIYQKEGQEFHCKLMACEPKKKRKAIGESQAMVPIFWTSANFSEPHMSDEMNKNVEWVYTEIVTVKAWRKIKAKLGLKGMQKPHIEYRSKGDGGFQCFMWRDDKIMLEKDSNGFTYMVHQNYQATAESLGYQDPWAPSLIVTDRH